MAEIQLERQQEPAAPRLHWAAPGVGKTYDMLSDAYRMKTSRSGCRHRPGRVHGRKETEDRIATSILFPALIPYRGST